MKSKYYILLFLLISNPFAQAQDLVHWGIKFGVDIPTNKQNYSELLMYNKTINYNAGLLLRIGDRWFGQIGADYHINKCTFDWEDTLSSIQNLELGYLSFPLQAGFYIVQGDEVSFRTLLGFQYKALVYLSKNDIGIARNYFQVHNLDVSGSLGLDFYSFNFDVGYRKSLFPVVSQSKHYRDMIFISAGLVF